MFKKDAVVKSKTGLHARPGSMVAEKAMNFDSEISLVFGDKKIKPKGGKVIYIDENELVKRKTK